MPFTAADPRALLELWERSLPLNAAAREALLAAEAGFVSSTLGAQRRHLLQALQRHVGSMVAMRCRCPACDATVAFDICLADLIDALPEADAVGEHRLDDGAWQLRFRLPAPDDLLALGDERDDERFAASLLRRCLIDARRDGQVIEQLPPELSARLSAQMETLDPAASLAFDVACTDCAHVWSAPFDPAQALLTFLQDEAESLLLDVDALARRYGWSEEQILALPPLRRQAYLQFARGD